MTTTPLELLEQLLDKYRAQAPAPPGDLSAQVEAFAALNPGATAEDWRALAIRLASAAWRDGYLHGQVEAARADDLEWLQRAEEAREYAEAQAALYARLRAEAQPGDQLAGLPNELARAEVLDAMGRTEGGWRVTVEDE